MIKLYGGDCLEVLPKQQSNIYDTLICDPPYGLEFMGKNWDRGIPGVRFWKEFLRVCKPGAIALVFGGTRTFHRLTCAIEDAGWEIRDCMMWLYGSGFPKSYNIAKGIDKLRDNEREVIGIQKVPGYAKTEVATGKQNRNVYEFPKTQGQSEWEGWGTALKPAWEPIIVAMKPLDGTFAQNAEKHGVAGLWIDGGRIGTDEIKENNSEYSDKGYWGNIKEAGKAKRWTGNGTNNPQGRWPANLILDEEAGKMLDEQSGLCKTGIFKKRKSGSQFLAYARNMEVTGCQGGDSGGASRFFYCAKASKKERNAGLEDMPLKPRGPVGDGLDNTLKGPTNALRKDKPTLSQNNHPTVKPLALMEYLCKLTKTPTGGHVLDPFGGSGTTALACMNTGRDCTIIEKEPSYCEIIRGRIRGNNTKKN